MYEIFADLHIHIGRAENGKPIKKKVVSIGVNLDERIADGFYMIKAYKLLSYILNNPKLLETKASEKISVPVEER